MAASEPNGIGVAQNAAHGVEILNGSAVLRRAEVVVGSHAKVGLGLQAQHIACGPLLRVVEGINVEVEDRFGHAVETCFKASHTK